MIRDYTEARTPYQLRRFIEGAEAGEWARYHSGFGPDSADPATMRLALEMALGGAAHIVQQTDDPAGAQNRRFDYMICRRMKR